MTDLAELRAEFPVLERIAYLNAGTNGPVPRRAVDAAKASLDRQAEEGRGGSLFFDALLARLETLRERSAELLGCTPDETALTGATTDGVNTALAALDLRPGDEILTSDEEHPGVLAPLALAKARRGVEVRVVPFAELPGEVGPRTRVVACSHVSWVSGAMVDAPALAATDALVLLDGAQGLGAVPIDVNALGCDFYAASGQKWLCGPNGVGYLYARKELADDLLPAWPGYGSVGESKDALELEPKPGARRFDSGLPAVHQADWALASLDVLTAPGIDRVHEHAAQQAADLAEQLAARGLKVVPRGPTTLVTWEAEDPVALKDRLAEAGVVIRDLPGRPYVRASVGAWSSEEDLERLVEVAAA